MALDVKSMREQRAKLVADAREIIASDNVDAEAEVRFDALMGEADKLKSRIDREERAIEAERELAAKVEARAEREGISVAQAEDRGAVEARAFDKWLRGGLDALDGEERGAMMTRAQGVGNGSPVGSLGGFTVPEGFYSVLTEALKAYGGMRQVATVITTASGNNLPMPTVNDTSNKGAILAENTQIGEQDVTFASKTLGAYKYTSKLIRVSYELMQDSAFNMQGFLAGALGERIGRITNEHFTTGDGSSKPVGLLAATGGAPKGADGAVTGAIDWTDLVNLIHSVDPAYRANGALMMHDSTVKALKMLKDGEDRPIWMPGIAVGEPDTILGYRYVVNQDFPVLDTTSPKVAAKVVTFGDHRAYFIRDVVGVQVVRLNERYADFLQVGFMAYSRHDGLLLDAGTNPVKHLLT
jgi:HK97 family phage major capsid protein